MRSKEHKIRLGLLAIVAAALITAVGVSCSSSGYGSNPSPMTTPTPGPTGTADVTITINGMNGALSYSPNPGPVKVGQKVAWRNADTISHTATGAGFDTGAVGPGATSAPITMSTAGNIAYHCSFHPTMVGTLSVTQ